MPDPVLVGAGDIASCELTGGASASGAAATAVLIENISGTVFTAGDDAYPSGTEEDFQDCYDATWGKFKDRTLPAPGNHDYVTDEGAPYFSYFGQQAGESGKGYYSTDLGAWHIIILNSNLYAEAGQAQLQWLKDDLDSDTAICTLAIWHHPLFSSGLHGNNDYVAPLWRALYDAGADVVINGHDHIYERYAPQDAKANADAQGMREFIVGTGGAPLYPLLFAKPNLEVRSATTFGVIKLTLHSSSYDWEFIPVKADGFTDTGTANCH
ncbi:MAG: metallophosphoesterase [Anaerolineae bacterium]